MKKYPAMIAVILFIMSLAPMALSFEIAETKQQNGQSSRPANPAPRYMPPGQVRTNDTNLLPRTIESEGVRSPRDGIIYPLSKGQRSVPKSIVKSSQDVEYRDGQAFIPRENVRKNYISALDNPLGAVYQARAQAEKNRLALESTKRELQTTAGNLRDITQYHKVYAKGAEEYVVESQKTIASLTGENDKLSTELKDQKIKYADLEKDYNTLDAAYVNLHKWIQRDYEPYIKYLKEALADEKFTGSLITKFLIVFIIICIFQFFYILYKTGKILAGKAKEKVSRFRAQPSFKSEDDAKLWVDQLQATYESDQEIECPFCRATPQVKYMRKHLFTQHPNECGVKTIEPDVVDPATATN